MTSDTTKTERWTGSSQTTTTQVSSYSYNITVGGSSVWDGGLVTDVTGSLTVAPHSGSSTTTYSDTAYGYVWFDTAQQDTIES